MTYIDVFNGDADGICSLVQLRLAEPRESILVTGVKRDIQLLKRLEVNAGDVMTVLDISMQKNHDDVQRLLASGAKIFYADHHHPGEIVEHSHLSTHIDRSPTKCTALIIDEYLQGRFHHWAITAAYGDNLTQVADEQAIQSSLNDSQRSSLKNLGISLNYNGYGEQLEDLFFHPSELYQSCVQFESPFEFIEQERDMVEILQQGYQQDMSRGMAQKPFYASDVLSAVMLPDEKWARRVSGVLGNALANHNPQRAHLIFSQKSLGGYSVSIRAPLTQQDGADEIAASFPTGGGRKGAAGINALPEPKIMHLIEMMVERYS